MSCYPGNDRRTEPNRETHSIMVERPNIVNASTNEYCCPRSDFAHGCFSNMVAVTIQDAAPARKIT